MFGAPETPAIEAMFTIEPPIAAWIIAPAGSGQHAHQTEHVDLEQPARVFEWVALDRDEHALQARAVDDPRERPMALDCSGDCGFIGDREGGADRLGAERQAVFDDSCSRSPACGWSARTRRDPRSASVLAVALPRSPAAPVTRMLVTARRSSASPPRYRRGGAFRAALIRTLSPEEPTKGASTLATIRRSSPS